MKKLLTFILGSILALNLSISVANSAAKEVRVAYFLEWPSPNLEDMQKKTLQKLLEYRLNGQTSQTVER